MAQTMACDVHDIQTVTGLQPCDSGAVRIDFRGGLSATLSPEHPDRDVILLQIDRSFRQGDLVGVMVDAAGRLVDLRYANRVTVRYVKDDEEDENRVMVAFWGFSSIGYLTRDHPDFERVRTTLAEAAANGSPVWFANRTWPVEGENEIWNRIMDARPAAEREKA
jgi:hypothetical protein